MTQDEQNTLAATVAAHENIIAFLLSSYLERLSAAQRKGLEAALEQPPDLSAMAPFRLDIETADDVAGMMMRYKDAVQRTYQLAFAKADSRSR